MKKNLRLFPASLDKDVFHFRLQKTSSRRFEDVLKRFPWDIFTTYHQVKLFWFLRQTARNFWEFDGQGTKMSYRVNSLNIPKLLRHFMKWLLPQTKILLLKSGIRKDVAASINKKSMNKSSTKNVFLRFYFFTLLNLLVAAYRGVFRNRLIIYNGAFFVKMLYGFKLLTIFARKASSQVGVRLVWK